MASGDPSFLQGLRPRRRLTEDPQRRTSEGVISAPPKAVLPQPDAIAIEPHSKIAFNAPFRVSHIAHLGITNSSNYRIAWQVKTTNSVLLTVVPSCGILDAKETILCAISCNSFKANTSDPVKDRVVIEWTNTPKGATKTFQRALFDEGELVIRRKNLPVEYNY